MTEKLLVIDDEHMILELTAMVLRSKGYDVSVTDNAIDGYKKIEQEQPAVVLLDYMMPQVNGLDALKEIRERFPQTYVIMFTGKGSEEIAVELMKAGASDYVLKPFSNANLVERIENVLKLRNIEIRNQELLEERERLLAEIEGWNRELEQRVQEKSEALERAHVEILQTEKLAALGHLSAGMVHEIRNPLNSIALFAQILQSGLTDNPEFTSYVDKVINEVERIDEILVKLLSTSKRSHYQLRTIKLQDVLGGVVKTFADQIENQKVDLAQHLPGDVPAILADEDELSQVFNNLIANALFEMPQGGRLGIDLGYDDAELQLRVSDTGGGIPEENKINIFDPFFTTKERGTGFGLSVVLRIVKTYGGRIEVDSTEGEGSCFTVVLPLG